MKSRMVVAAILCLVIPCAAQSARDYYNELYKAGGLDRMADVYVCFDDDPALQTFFIYAESDVLKEFLTDNGAFAKLPKREQQELNKGFVIVRGYEKGVALRDEDFYKNVTDSVKAGSGRLLMRMRLNETPTTLRYKRAVEILNPDLTLNNEVSRSGRHTEYGPTLHSRNLSR